MNRMILAVVIVATFLNTSVPASAQYGLGTFHYALIDQSNQILHIWVYGSTTGPWTNLNNVTGGPSAQAWTQQTMAALTGFGDSVGDHLFYVDNNRHISQMYYCAQNCIPLGTWTHQDMTNLAGGAPVPEFLSRLSSFGYSNQEHVFYTGTNHHVYQLVQTSTGSWTYQDLTTAVPGGGALAVTGSALTSFADSFGEHIIYVGTNQHVYQLYYSWSSKAWVDQDLNSMASGAPVAASGSALTSFLDSQEHIVYQATNQHLYQFYTHPGSWLYQDLITGGALPSLGTQLASNADGGYEFVFFATGCTSYSCSVNQAVFNGSVWTDYNLNNSVTTSPFTPFPSAGIDHFGNFLLADQLRWEFGVGTASVCNGNGTPCIGFPPGIGGPTGGESMVQFTP